MDEEGEESGCWWERWRSYKDERGLTCLPQVLQKINPQMPRQVDVIGKVDKIRPRSNQ